MASTTSSLGGFYYWLCGFIVVLQFLFLALNFLNHFKLQSQRQFITVIDKISPLYPALLCVYACFGFAVSMNALLNWGSRNNRNLFSQCSFSFKPMDNYSMNGHIPSFILLTTLLYTESYFSYNRYHSTVRVSNHSGISYRLCIWFGPPVTPVFLALSLSFLIVALVAALFIPAFNILAMAIHLGINSYFSYYFYEAVRISYAHILETSDPKTRTGNAKDLSEQLDQIKLTSQVAVLSSFVSVLGWISLFDCGSLRLIPVQVFFNVVLLVAMFTKNRLFLKHLFHGRFKRAYEMIVSAYIVRMSTFRRNMAEQRKNERKERLRSASVAFMNRLSTVGNVLEASSGNKSSHQRSVSSTTALTKDEWSDINLSQTSAAMSRILMAYHTGQPLPMPLKMVGTQSEDGSKAMGAGFRARGVSDASLYSGGTGIPGFTAMTVEGAAIERATQSNSDRVGSPSKSKSPTSSLRIKVAKSDPMDGTSVAPSLIGGRLETIKSIGFTGQTPTTAPPPVQKKKSSSRYSSHLVHAGVSSPIDEEFLIGRLRNTDKSQMSADERFDDNLHTFNQLIISRSMRGEVPFEIISLGKGHTPIPRVVMETDPFDAAVRGPKMEERSRLGSKENSNTLYVDDEMATPGSGGARTSIISTPSKLGHTPTGSLGSELHARDNSLTHTDTGKLARLKKKASQRVGFAKDLVLDIMVEEQKNQSGIVHVSIDVDTPEGTAEGSSLTGGHPGVPSSRDYSTTAEPSGARRSTQSATVTPLPLTSTGIAPLQVELDDGSPMVDTPVVSESESKRISSGASGSGMSADRMKVPGSMGRSTISVELSTREKFEHSVLAFRSPRDPKIGAPSVSSAATVSGFTRPSYSAALPMSSESGDITETDTLVVLSTVGDSPDMIPDSLILQPSHSESVGLDTGRKEVLAARMKSRGKHESHDSGSALIDAAGTQDSHGEAVILRDGSSSDEDSSSKVETSSEYSDERVDDGDDNEDSNSVSIPLPKSAQSLIKRRSTRKRGVIPTGPDAVGRVERQQGQMEYARRFGLESRMSERKKRAKRLYRSRSDTEIYGAKKRAQIRALIACAVEQGGPAVVRAQQQLHQGGKSSYLSPVIPAKWQMKKNSTLIDVLGDAHGAGVVEVKDRTTAESKTGKRVTIVTPEKSEDDGVSPSHFSRVTTQSPMSSVSETMKVKSSAKGGRTHHHTDEDDGLVSGERDKLVSEGKYDGDDDEEGEYEDDGFEDSHTTSEDDDVLMMLPTVRKIQEKQMKTGTAWMVPSGLRNTMRNFTDSEFDPEKSQAMRNDFTDFIARSGFTMRSYD